MGRSTVARSTDNERRAWPEPGQVLRRGRQPCGYLRHGAALALFGLVALRAASASAQTITLGPDNTIERTVEYRKSGNKPYWISYSDCVLDATMSFPVKVTNTSLTLEVWAGSDDCGTLRSSQDRKQCWLVQRVTPRTDTFDIVIPVRNVVARRTDSEDVPADLTASVCEENTDSGGQAFTYYFMQVNSGQAEVTVPWGASGKAGFDMAGPAPPGKIRVGLGESRLTIGMDDFSEEADRQRFRAFCVPAGTAGPSVDAGAAGSSAVAADDAGLLDGGVAGAGGSSSTGSDAGSGAPAACANGILRTGRRAPVTSEYQCGESSEISSSIRTTRLVNDTTYALAVAGEDAIGNTGTISEIKCGTPIVLDDFYEVYSRSGGPGGGGFCNVAPASKRGGWASLGLVAFALALAARRTRQA